MNKRSLKARRASSGPHNPTNEPRLLGLPIEEIRSTFRMLGTLRRKPTPRVVNHLRVVNAL